VSAATRDLSSLFSYDYVALSQFWKRWYTSRQSAHGYPMKVQTDAIGLVTLVFVLLAWFVFAFIFLLRKKPPQGEVAKRATVSRWGIILQSFSFAAVWSLPRSSWWPARSSLFGELALAAVAVVLTYASCLLCLWAIRTLGKQWTFQARVIKGHELVTQGPYAIVRNPIYLGMFGLIVGTGFAYSRWWTLLAAVIVFLLGNRIRIRAEETLLRETFGSQFDDYARRVPAFFPRLF
jgi:protein-S-isoprenylcysteine O-methyltransferase Ste14